tara:strand:+ start:260 stop:775 length:516 start_codon:yes stop_codon:yes gene_type:complete
MVTIDELFSSPPMSWDLKEETTLSEAEILTARVVASMRTGLNRQSGTPDAKKCDRDGFEIDLDGVGGEMAFAKLKNLCPDLGALPRSGGHDFLTKNGRTLDVKTTSVKHGNLLVGENKANAPSDFYVLMTGKFPTYEYVGWASSKQVFKAENLVDLGYGKVYRVWRKDLRK